MDYFGDENNITAVIAALNKDAIPILRTLAELSPFCGDAGFKLWQPDDLMEIADRLEKK